MRATISLFAAIILFGACGCKAQPVDSTLYAESPITLHTTTGDIFGTLCVPANAKQYPVALIIAGSGPTDRDGNSPIGLYSDCYKILAHRLAVNGIATVRYDKRGIGESRSAMTNEADLRFDNYVDDARAWMDSLKHSGRFTQVIVIGHSEGSTIGMIAAARLRRSAADKYISIAGPGESADAILKEQLATMTEPKRDTAYRIIDSLVAGDSVRYVPVKLRVLFRPSVQPYIISWFKYSPQEEIKKLHIPVLIIQGTNDIQVDTTQAKLLAAANAEAKLVLIPNMNHVFRIVAGDRMANVQTYNNPDLPISDELVNTISKFILGG